MSTQPTTRRQRRTTIALAMVAGSAVTLLLLWLASQASQWAGKRGRHVYPTVDSLSDSLLAVPGKWMQDSDVQHLRIAVKDRHMQVLQQKRRQALDNGVLESSSEDMVPASLSTGSSVHRVKLRLKGDWTDHLQGSKWSLRVQVRDDSHVFGMRRFSLQHPGTRGYQGEPMFFAALRELGVVTPRYQLVTVTMNNTSLGLMALEEHFATELLEHNRRGDSPILRFDESLVFRGLDDYRTAPVRTFQEGRVNGDPALRRDYRTAGSLLRGFVQRTLPASSVFDLQETGAMLAVCELFGAQHALRWHNLRFYYDPLRARLAPIGFDGNLHERTLGRASVTATEPITRQMLRDPILRRAFHRQLGILRQRLADGSLLGRLTAIDEHWRKLLQPEFVMLEQYPLHELTERIELLSLGGTPSNRERLPKQHTSPVRAFLVRGNRDAQLQIVNTVPRRVVLREIHWLSEGRRTPLVADEELSLPIDLEPIAPGIATSLLSITCPSPGPDAVVELHVTCGGIDATVLSVEQPPIATQPAIATSTIDEQLARHPFLSLDEDGRTLRVAPGTWTIERTLRVPRDAALVVTDGTELCFSKDAALIAHGPVQMLGDASRPIRLCGIEQAAWPGITVNTDDASDWQFVTVENATGIEQPTFRSSGAVTFHGGTVSLQNTQLRTATAACALRLVHTKFELHRVTIEDAKADALHAEHCHGRITDSRVRRTVGDGLEILGGKLTITDTELSDVAAKALCTALGSAVHAARLVVERAGAGVACKDGSQLDISDCTFAECGNSLTAYTRKQEYGPARIRAERLNMRGAPSTLICQPGNEIVIDGVRQPTRPVEGNELHEPIRPQDRDN